MAARKRHGVALKQYRKVNNKWQFVSVAAKKGIPDPRLCAHRRGPAPSGGGTFYLDYRDASGKRKQVPVGRSPAEALDAWKLRIGIRAGIIEPDPDEEPQEANQGKTIEQAVQDYLAEVKATKGKSTLSQYTHDLAWFQSLSKSGTSRNSIAPTSCGCLPLGARNAWTASRLIRRPSIAA